jgi:hypothetical protein
LEEFDSFLMGTAVKLVEMWMRRRRAMNWKRFIRRR